jgi:hypothetical protein
MAGKKKINQDKKDGRGGKRKGAGQPSKKPVDFDHDLKSEVIEKAKKKEKETGKSPVDVALDMLYDSEIQDAVRVSVWKSYVDLFAIKKSEQDVKVTKNDGPKIYIPKRKEDPALKVVGGTDGKKT